jgi:hypothetical protein
LSFAKGYCLFIFGYENKEQMKNGFILPLFCIIFCSLLFGCKARKNIARSSASQSVIDVKSTTSDSSKTVASYQVDSTRQIAEKDNSYIRTVDYDSLGFVRRIREEWRDVGRSDMALHRGSGSYISMNNMQAVVASSDSSETVSSVDENSQTDSRPVQGFEFVWVFVGIAVALVIVFFFVVSPIK